MAGGLSQLILILDGRLLISLVTSGRESSIYFVGLNDYIINVPKGNRWSKHPMLKYCLFLECYAALTRSLIMTLPVMTLLVHSRLSLFFNLTQSLLMSLLFFSIAVVSVLARCI